MGIEEHAHPVEGEGIEDGTVLEENEALRNGIRDISDGIMHVLDFEGDNRVVDRRDFVRARQAATDREERQQERQHADHQPVAWVAGDWSTLLQKGH